MTQPIQMHRRASGNSRNYHWCTCGAPWVNGRCGRVAVPLVPGAFQFPRVHAPAQRRLAWGPFGVAITVTVILDALLLWGAAALVGVGGAWATLGAAFLLFVAFAATVVFVASGLVALRRGR
jgi:hypothetical protein